MIPTKALPGDAWKIEKKDQPSPGSYNFDESFKKTQLVHRQVVISRSNILGFADLAVKLKGYIPGSGTYNPETAFKNITLGASRGWK